MTQEAQSNVSAFDILRSSYIDANVFQLAGTVVVIRDRAGNLAVTVTFTTTEYVPVTGSDLR